MAQSKLCLSLNEQLDRLHNIGLISTNLIQHALYYDLHHTFNILKTLRSLKTVNVSTIEKWHAFKNHVENHCGLDTLFQNIHDIQIEFLTTPSFRAILRIIYYVVDNTYNELHKAICELQAFYSNTFPNKSEFLSESTINTIDELISKKNKIIQFIINEAWQAEKTISLIINKPTLISTFEIAQKNVPDLFVWIEPYGWSSEECFMLFGQNPDELDILDAENEDTSLLDLDWICFYTNGATENDAFYGEDWLNQSHPDDIFDNLF